MTFVLRRCVVDIVSSCLTFVCARAEDDYVADKGE